MDIELHLLDLKYEHLKVRQHREEKRLVGSMAQQGQLSPLVVVASSGSSGRYVVIDGFKRIRAARKVGLDILDAVVWEDNEVDALVLMHTLQRPRERSSLEDAYLIQALQDEHGLSQGEIGFKLGRSRSWVSRRLGLLRDLPEWLQERVRDGAIQCYSATRHLLPLARANRADTELLARNIASLGLSTRDIAELHAAWREGDDEGRRLVVNQPQVVLAARRAAEWPGLDDASDSTLLLQDMEKVVSLLRRCRGRLQRILLEGMESTVTQRVCLLWRRLEATATLVGTRLQEEGIVNARPGQTQSDPIAAATGIRGTQDRADSEGLAVGRAEGAS